MRVEIPDELVDLVRCDAQGRLDAAREQFHALERTFGAEHPDTQTAQRFYDKAQRLVALFAA